MDRLARLLEEIDQLTEVDRARLRIALGAVDEVPGTDLGIDELTGALDGEGFGAAATAMMARVDRSAERLQLVRVDLDRFTAYNEGHGRDAGDAALRAMANALRAVFRSSDVIGRVGPDDFAVLCAGSGAATMFLSRIDDAFRSRCVGLPPITASIAVVRATGYTSLDALLAAADSAVLRAMVDAAYRRVRR